MEEKKKPNAKNLPNLRYREKAFDSISFTIKKGKREEYKEAAKARGLGLAELFRIGADEYIENHPVPEKQTFLGI